MVSQLILTHELMVDSHTAPEIYAPHQKNLGTFVKTIFGLLKHSIKFEDIGIRDRKDVAVLPHCKPYDRISQPHIATNCRNCPASPLHQPASAKQN